MSNTDFEDQTRNWPGFPGPPWGWGGGGHPGGCGCPQCRPPRECWPPPCPPGPGWDWNWRPPHGAIVGPIIGVTDGSNAKPGEVGEYISGIINYTNVPMPAGAVLGQVYVVPSVVTPIIIPPGDWDIEPTWRAGFGISSFFVSLTPQPAGVSSLFVATAQAQADMRFFDWTFNSPRGQASVSVPTALVFTVQLGLVGQSSEDQSQVVGSGGWFTTIVTARRMR